MRSRRWDRGGRPLFSSLPGITRAAKPTATTTAPPSAWARMTQVGTSIRSCAIKSTPAATSPAAASANTCLNLITISSERSQTISQSGRRPRDPHRCPAPRFDPRTPAGCGTKARSRTSQGGTARPGFAKIDQQSNSVCPPNPTRSAGHARLRGPQRDFKLKSGNLRPGLVSSTNGLVAQPAIRVLVSRVRSWQCLGTLPCELRKCRDTSKSMMPVPPVNSKLARHGCGFRVRALVSGTQEKDPCN
jgi:hypothetical protein